MRLKMLKLTGPLFPLPKKEMLKMCYLLKNNTKNMQFLKENEVKNGKIDKIVGPLFPLCQKIDGKNVLFFK
jgi:hypothetical protein